MPNKTRLHRSESLGPNLQSRLEALEAAMGVRLNVAKRQGRQSLSNASSSSPMQISPTSTASTTGSSTTLTSISNSSRHNIPSRTGQGVQRSASSCDVENRPGPIKRLKPSNMVEQSASSAPTAVATLKKYPPSVRRALATPAILTNSSSTTVTTTTVTTNTINSASTNNASVRSSQSKQPTTVTKPRSSPMDISSARSSRSSTANNTNSSISSNSRNSHNSSPKITTRPSVKQRTAYVSPPPPPRPATLPRKQRQSVFGEQFSDDMLKTNLLWINLNELDDDARTEILIQFGSIERFLHEQRLFIAQQQRQLKLTTGNQVRTNRSRLDLLTTKKDRLELL